MARRIGQRDLELRYFRVPDVKLRRLLFVRRDMELKHRRWRISRGVPGRMYAEIVIVVRDEIGGADTPVIAGRNDDHSPGRAGEQGVEVHLLVARTVMPPHVPTQAQV